MFETEYDFVKASRDSLMGEHRESKFAGSGGTELFCQAWMPPPGQTRAVLVNLHGLGDHSGLYPSLETHFPPRGIAVYAFDMRGNGRSKGQRGYVAGWHQYREDLARFLGRVRAWEPEQPLFLLGNSLGGLVVLEYAMHHPDGLAGIIAAAPALGKLGVPAVLMALGRLFSRVVPRFSLRVGMDLTGLARDPAVVQAVVDDPLFHRWGTARLSTEVTDAIARVHQGAPGFTLPLLILHGSADRMVPPDGSREFFAKLRQSDRTYKEYPGAYHGLFADLNSAEVLHDLEQWILAHVPARKA